MSNHITLDRALDAWAVFDDDDHDGPVGWYAVADEDGIVAYFAHELDAFRFRLAEINRMMNG
jgi:hypothetical protein